MSERRRHGDGSSGAVTITAVTASMMTAVTAASMGWQRLRIVSASTCQHSRARADGVQQAEMSDVHMWADVGGLTLARVVALAAQEGPPSPVLRPVPNPRVGRAMHSRVHTRKG